MYVYKQTEPGVWTVGYYTPQGEWISESDYPTPKEAANRTAWLNGSDPWFRQARDKRALSQ